MYQDDSYETDTHKKAPNLSRLPGLVFCIITLAVTAQSNNQVPVLFDSEPLIRSLVLPMIVTAICGFHFLLHRMAMGSQIVTFDLAIAAMPTSLIALRASGLVSPWVLVLCAVLLAVAFARTVQLLHPDRWRAPLWIPFALWLLLAIGGTLLSSFAPIVGFQFIGALSIGLLWLGLVLFGVSVLFDGHWWRRLVFVGLLGVFFLNENQHVISQTDLLDESGETYVFPSEANRSTLAPTAFYSWLAQREDAAKYVDSSRPYPIFLVASQGGGGYAAAHAYTFLSKLQARCPQFLHHTFALVGVSGGAVGNSMFYADHLDELSPNVGQDCDKAPEDTPFQQFENPDMLSPVIGTMLFRDFPNRLSFGALGDFGRSDALLDTIRTGRDVAPLSAGYTNHFWKLSSDGEPLVRGGPAVISVATNVDYGSRYLFAPFQLVFQYGLGRYGQFLSDMNIGLDPLGASAEASSNASRSSADVGFFDTAVTSAAFPWVSPSRLLQIPYWQRSAGNLVDGGYYEGTGAQTLADLHAELTFIDIEPFPLEAERSNLDDEFIARGCEQLTIETIHPWPEVIPADQTCIFNITFHTVLVGTAFGGDGDIEASENTNFFLDPISAVLSTRGQRSLESISNLLQEQCRGCDPVEILNFLHEGRIHTSVLDLELVNMPLGWLMPDDAIRELEDLIANMGAPEIRETLDWPEPERGFGQTSARNAGELERIMLALDGI